MNTYFIIIVVGLLLAIMLYKRYFPVLGIPCENSSHDKVSTVALDWRDYNIDVNHHQNSIRIPFAYLKRCIQEVPNEKLPIIANDRLELNLGIRYLLARDIMLPVIK